MDLVTVPLVWPTTEISSTLDLLKSVRRSGLVRLDGPDVYTLLFAGNLLRARAAGRKILAECEGGETIVLLDPPVASAFGLDLVRPQRTWQAYEQMLDSRSAMYGLIAEGKDEVMLVTRHEDKTRNLSQTGGFECTGNPTHYFPEPFVVLGDKCPQRAECWIPGSPEPTIRLA